LSAVLRACSLTCAVFNNLVKNETLTKDDKSPVTVADYSAQAVINTILSNAFPLDPVVGEEDSSDLRVSSSETASHLKTRITDLANDALTAPVHEWERHEWGIGPSHRRRTVNQVLDAIDRGKYAGGKLGRLWTLDPIDGTKGFLRGGQYAVCLALVVDSIVQVGVIGCPNLHVDVHNPNGEKGCIFVAVRGEGAEQRPISNPHSSLPIRIPSRLPSELTLLESYEPSHSSHSISARIIRHLGITQPPLRMDSQAKYCSLARGDGSLYLRMPTGVGYVEKIWDHASGSLLVTEAGGVISDSRGRPLDFGLGRTLGENWGIVASDASVHGQVIEAIKKAQAED